MICISNDKRVSILVLLQIEARIGLKNERMIEQAGAELGQAQPRLGLKAS